MARHAARANLIPPPAVRIRPTGLGTNVVLAACFGIPALVLLACYLWLAVAHGTFLVRDVVVHESGRYTLAQTVLYFGHFLREVPIDVAYALFLLSAAPALTGAAAPRATARTRTLGWTSLALAAILLLLALVLSARSHGWTSAARDLLQFRTRDDLIAYGSHWQFHWLSTFWFGAAVGIAAAFANRLRGMPAAEGSRLWQRIAWGYFAVFTVIFGISARVFTDLRYVGHQAREILTHGPVTLLLGIGLVVCSGVWLRMGEAPDPVRGTRGLWLRLAALLLIPAYLAAVALTGDVMAEGQSEGGLAAMVAAHYFEHVLDYAFVGLLVLGGLAIRAASAAGRSVTRGTGPALAHDLAGG